MMLYPTKLLRFNILLCLSCVGKRAEHNENSPSENTET